MLLLFLYIIIIFSYIMLLLSYILSSVSYKPSLSYTLNAINKNIKNNQLYYLKYGLSHLLPDEIISLTQSLLRTSPFGLTSKTCGTAPTSYKFLKSSMTSAFLLETASHGISLKFSLNWLSVGFRKSIAWHISSMS